MLVAEKLNRNCIGIEINPNYIEIVKKRLKPYIEQTKLNGDRCTLEVKNYTNEA